MGEGTFITMVFPANVEKLWGLAAPLLVPAVDLYGTHDIEDVRKAIMSGTAQLWVQWNKGRVEAALVSEFKDFPKGLWLNIWLFGVHPDFSPAEAEFEVNMIDYAKANRCKAIMHTGREGWERRHKQANLKVRKKTIYLFDLG